MPAFPRAIQDVLDQAYVRQWQGGGLSDDDVQTIGRVLPPPLRTALQAKLDELSAVQLRDHVSRVQLDFARRLLGIT